MTFVPFFWSEKKKGRMHTEKGTNVWKSHSSLFLLTFVPFLGRPPKRRLNCIRPFVQTRSSLFSTRLFLFFGCTKKRNECGSQASICYIRAFKKKGTNVHSSLFCLHSFHFFLHSFLFFGMFQKKERMRIRSFFWRHGLWHVFWGCVWASFVPVPVFGRAIQAFILFLGSWFRPTAHFRIWRGKFARRGAAGGGQYMLGFQTIFCDEKGILDIIFGTSVGLEDRLYAFWIALEVIRTQVMNLKSSELSRRYLTFGQSWIDGVVYCASYAKKC